MPSYRAAIRLVTPQGQHGLFLPDYRNLEYLDDDTDVGAIKFDYPIGGRNGARLENDTEIALLVDGFELPNGRFLLEEYDGNTVVDGDKPARTWAGPSLINMLDEALVLPAHDQHLREDVFTNAEHREFERKREEWYQKAIRQAIREAKQQAQEHNDRVRDKRNDGGSPGSVILDDDVNRWGRKAIKWATAQISNRSQDWYRMCQSFVRQSFGLPGIYGTANEAWFAGTKRTNTPVNQIPAGVPVYWGPNHVALSIGGGDCISTDVLRAGWPDIVPISSLNNGVHWSLTFRGWSTEVSNHKIYP